MEDIFNVDKYRNYLESFFVYKYDEDTFLDRKKQIDKYTDLYLKKIIDDTKIFICFAIDKIKSENKIFDERIYSSFDICDNTHFISNGCIGGWHADALYSLRDFDSDFRVSKYLLNEFFAGFKIEENEDVIECYDDKEDAGYFYLSSKLTITGPIKKFEEIIKNDNLNQEKEYEFIKVLELVKNKK